jgi:hypothetical protein
MMTKTLRSLFLLPWFSSVLFVNAVPTIFWGPDSLAPGNIVLLYGGDLNALKEVSVQVLPNGKTVTAPVLQPCENSLKFEVPSTLEAGVYSVQGGNGKPFLLNRPEIWFLQPTVLQPGLNENQAPPGSTVQIVGKNFLLPGDKGAPMVRLSNHGKNIELKAEKAEKFSLLIKLPADLAEGAYEMRINNGFGGEPGWSETLKIDIKKADVWPGMVFNVKQFGAKGDDVADDTQAIRDALAAAEKNGGGVVLLPWGTYRLKDWIYVPERTTLRGAGRDATILKWPVDEPQKVSDFTKAAIYTGNRCALEDFTLIVRKVNCAVLDLSREVWNHRTIPPEIASHVYPWGMNRDKFFRRLRFQHWLLVGHPESVLQPPKPAEGAKPDPTATLDPEKLALARKYAGVEADNFDGADLRNFEVSDCEFQGAQQKFYNVTHGRIVRNSFTSTLGYCYTLLGGGAIDVVCEGNTLAASSSWGWGWNGMQRVYSAHNKSLNLVRGEREAMTLDISSLPTARPFWQYWGTPVEIGNDPQKPTLRFPAPTEPANADGFRTGWTPGCFRGGSVILHAYASGGTGNTRRNIIDNTADTLTLDQPFKPALTTTYEKGYLEVAPRHAAAHGGTTAWIGRIDNIQPNAFTAREARWVPDDFIGMAAIILDGKGAGQYRLVKSNTESQAVLERPWEVVPDVTSVVGVWSLMRHMIVYDCEGYDTSAFAQLYGAFYDYTVDRCRVERSQGIWGQMGWFVQFRDNVVRYAYSFHPKISMRGPNPEGNAPFGFTGLDGSRLRVTKSGSFQFPEKKLPLFVDDIMGAPVPSTLGHIQRGNVLSYGHRLIVQAWNGDKPPNPKAGGGVYRDVVIDGNRIEHSAVGIQLGPDVRNAVTAHNTFDDVVQPLLLAQPGNVQVIEAKP